MVIALWSIAPYKALEENDIQYRRVKTWSDFYQTIRDVHPIGRQFSWDIGYLLLFQLLFHL